MRAGKWLENSVEEERKDEIFIVTGGTEKDKEQANAIAKFLG